MMHPTEEDLILQYFGESPEGPQVEKHLAECPTCRAAYGELASVMELTAAVDVPSRGDGYGAEVWARVEPKLTAGQGARSWFRWPSLVAAGAVAAAIALLLLLAPRVRNHPERGGEELASLQRDAILRLEAGNHFERAERFLLELRNEGAAIEADRAGDLLHSNRLLRQAAKARGMPAVADVLEELEITLTEAAHAEDHSVAEDEDEPPISYEILFKVRMLGDRLRRREVAHARKL